MGSGARRHNLPTALTSFVGREDEVAVAIGLLQQRRLVTFTGAGGCGKTRLAVEVARAAADKFAAGVWFVDMTAAIDGSGVARSALAAVGLDEVAGESAAQRIAEHLGDQEALLVLDNCEQVLAETANLVWRLVQSCGRVHLLATSREPLGINGEATFRVPSLGTPERADHTECASVRLFLDRAALANAPDGVAASDLPDVAAICTRLDGIPLAIELAAAACGALTPRQIAEQLADRLDPPTGSRSSVPARHRTLAASIDWSYRLLAEDERTVLRGLSVFAGGFSLEAAQALCARPGSSSGRVAEIVVALVGKSLIERRPGPGPARFRLLEIVRQHMRQLLVEREEAALLLRHAEHLLQVVEKAGRDLLTSRISAAMAVLDAELDNIRAADEWLCRTGNADAALRLHGALTVYWSRRSPGEGIQRAERALALPGGTHAARAAAQLALARCAFYAGRLESARAAIRAARLVAEQLADEGLAGELMSWAGLLEFLDGDPTGVDTQLRARDLLAEFPARRGDCVVRLGICAQISGDSEKARHWLIEAAAEADRSEHPFGWALAMSMLATELTMDGEFRQAEPLFLAVEDTFAELGVHHFVYNASLARVLAAQGRTAEALARIADQQETARRGSNRWQSGWLAWARTVIEYGYCPGGADAGHLAEATSLLETIGGTTSWAAVWCEAIRAEMLAGAGDTAQACSVAAAAEARARQPHNGRAWRRVRLAQARIRWRQGGVSESEQLAHDVLRDGIERGAAGEPIEALELLAALAGRGEALSATRLLGAAAAARESRGYPLPPNEAPLVHVAGEAARAVLGPDGFAEAWAEGAALTLTEAASYAARGRGNRRRPERGWDSLTPTERQVVELVARGLRNADVAKALFVAPATVKTHLISVFRKLEVSTRAELTALALDRER